MVQPWHTALYIFPLHKTYVRENECHCNSPPFCTGLESFLKRHNPSWQRDQSFCGYVPRLPPSLLNSICLCYFPNGAILALVGKYANCLLLWSNYSVEIGGQGKYSLRPTLPRANSNPDLPV